MKIIEKDLVAKRDTSIKGREKERNKNPADIERLIYVFSMPKRCFGWKIADIGG
jgi:hypothetical protein